MAADNRDGDEDGTGDGDRLAMSPDDAFAVLGNETRMAILQALGDADGPMAFSEVRDRVGLRDSGQFNYHLDQLTGHFVRKTEAGYALREAGRRVVEAVLSGAVTELPHVEPTVVDWPCPYCGGDVTVAYDDDPSSTTRPVTPACTECAGVADVMDHYAEGQIADLQFSPAGIRGRTPQELLEAAITWDHLEVLAAFCDVCPRCTARIDHSLTVCARHDAAADRCPACERRYAAHLASRCTNCIFEIEGVPVWNIVIAHVDMIAFLATHDINPLCDPWFPGPKEIEEDIRSRTPFEARFTFRLDGDAISVTVDDDLGVVETTWPAEPA